MAFVAHFIGSLVPTFLVSRLFLYLFKRWDGGWLKILVAHVGSISIAAVIAGYGFADGGEPKFLYAFDSYLLPQLFWLGIDLWRNTPASQPKEPVATGGSKTRFSLTTVGPYIVYVIAFVLAVLFFPKISYLLGNKTTGGADNFAPKWLQKVAVDLNRLTPKMVNQITRWEKTTTGPGHNLTYHYTFLTDQQLAAADMVSKTTTSACSSPDLKVYFGEGVTIHWRYTDKNGKFLHETTVRPVDCKR